MHDPQSVLWDIKNPLAKKKNGYRPALFTIWHVDPEKDNTDDSCGRFMRLRHCPKEVVEKVRKDFTFEFEHNYWFNEGGYPKFSTIGIAVEMYSKASWAIHGHYYGFSGNGGRRKHKRFMRKHLFDIIHFAENPTDSLHSYIHMTFGVVKQEERISEFVSIIVADIFHKMRPWYKDPKWHIHHWRIQNRVWQSFYRRYFEKCAGCGKRGFTGAAYGEWEGKRVWHQQCYNAPQPTPLPE